MCLYMFEMVNTCAECWTLLGKRQGHLVGSICDFMDVCEDVCVCVYVLSDRVSQGILSGREHQPFSLSA